MNHEERLHEYGEGFELYPCKQCGFRGSDIVSLEDIKVKHMTVLKQTVFP